MYIYRTLFTAIVMLLMACESMMTDDINSPYYKIRSGSSLVLEKPVTIPAGYADIKFQSGQLTSAVDQYSVNCEFRVRDLGPQSIEPDNFIISRSGDGEEWISHGNIKRYYKILTLHSKRYNGITSLECQVWDDPRPGRTISVPDIRAAVGHYFSFNFSDGNAIKQGSGVTDSR